MARARRSRLWGIGALCALSLPLVTSPLWGRHLARQLPWFEVRRVEISGTRLVAPHEVLAASGIRHGQHLLDAFVEWETALRDHPVIADVRLTRKLPHTLRIRVIEKQPVALVSEGNLRLVTADGELLPVDPAAVPLDLPIVHGRLDDTLSIAAIRRMLADVARLSEIAPDLMRDVSEVRLAPSATDVLLLSHRSTEILLPIGAPVIRLEELRRVLADTHRRFPVEPTGGGKHRLDLRFADQVVVRPSSSRERS